MGGMSTEKPGALWALIQQWLDSMPFPPSQRKVAERLGVSSSALNNWKYGRGFPTPAHVQALADLIGVHRDRVLDAVLIDQGYRDAPPDSRREKEA